MRNGCQFAMKRSLEIERKAQGRLLTEACHRNRKRLSGASAKEQLKIALLANTWKFPYMH